jgi:hypothetical protein
LTNFNKVFFSVYADGRQCQIYTERASFQNLRSAMDDNLPILLRHDLGVIPNHSVLVITDLNSLLTGNIFGFLNKKNPVLIKIKTGSCQIED